MSGIVLENRGTDMPKKQSLCPVAETETNKSQLEYKGSMPPGFREYLSYKSIWKPNSSPHF